MGRLVTRIECYDGHLIYANINNTFDIEFTHSIDEFIWDLNVYSLSDTLLLGFYIFYISIVVNYKLWIINRKILQWILCTSLKIKTYNKGPSNHQHNVLLLWNILTQVRKFISIFNFSVLQVLLIQQQY